VNSSILGSALGVGIGMLISTYALVAGQRWLRDRPKSHFRYPNPDWLDFVKRTTSIVAFLIALHWAPELAALFGLTGPNKPFYSERRFQGILFIGHAMAFTSISAHLLGLLWATWQAKVKGVESINSTTDVSGRADR